VGGDEVQKGKLRIIKRISRYEKAVSLKKGEGKNRDPIEELGKRSRTASNTQPTEVLHLKTNE